MKKNEYYKSLFTGELVGKTIKKIHFDDNETGSNNDYPISAIEFEDGTSLVLSGSGQVEIDTVWASLEKE